MTAKTTTYSFSDVLVTIGNTLIGQETSDGAGLGNIQIEWANDNTVHNVAADASVMVTKVEANNGTITLTMQQTSALHYWLYNMFEAHYLGPTVNWASPTITVSSLLGTQQIFKATGVSCQKRAGQPFQKEGQEVTWTLMAADLSPFATVAKTIPSLNVKAEILNNI